MPTTKPVKTVRSPRKDIRSFFGTSQTSALGSQTKRVAAQGSRETDAIEISDEDDKTPETKPAKQPSKPRSLAKGPSSAANLFDDDDEIQAPKPKAIPTTTQVPKRKRPSALLSSDDEEDDIKPAPPPAKAKPAPAASVSSKAKPSAQVKPPAKRRRKDDDFIMDDDDDVSEKDDDDDDLIPSKSKKAKAPVKTAAPKKAADVKDKSKADPTEIARPKFNWAAAKAAKLAGPSAPGSKQVPQPASENCLANLSFVFTGELSSFSRDEAVDLAKRYGGRVVGQPSSKTSYVVLGDNAGPSKLAAIKKHGLKTLSEDEFLNLIATRVVRDKDLDPNIKKKMQKEQEAIRQTAKEMEKREKGKGVNKENAASKPVDFDAQLWTVRYAPQTLKEICGNKGQVEKLQQWLHDWPQSLKAGFKKPGKNGMNMFRAVLITGGPGIGKTTSAHLCAKLEGFTVIELNASDARSKKLIENGMNINDTSLDGWMHGGEATNAAGVVITDRTCIIMDEVDGMSAGDRGGVGALNALIKKTKVPIICIANDRGAQKLKPLMSTTFSLPFRKPEAAAIRSRIMTIAYKEKMNIPPNVVDQLVNGAQSDIRQVLNMLSIWKLSSDEMTFDEGKALSEMNAKYSIMTPFDVTGKILGPYLFSATARETLGDKMELYFHDHSFMPLFIQENYLKMQPARVRGLDGPEKIMTQLRLMDQAASSISDGDLVDALIHGPEQHWSLMPLHAVCSTVRPASFVYGTGGGYGGPNAISFPQWLGQNSKQGKLGRQLGDVQIRMRLKVSGDKAEIRQSYLPALFPHIVKPLIDVGASAVEEVIARMDEYYLSKEDWDTVVELGVDQSKDDIVLKKITSATKSTFTRKYNSTDHPIPYHKAQDLGKLPRKIGPQAVPDLEEAFDNDDVPDAVSDDEKGKQVDDISNDKLIKAPKKKGKKTEEGKAGASKGKGKGKA